MGVGSMHVCWRCRRHKRSAAATSTRSVSSDSRSNRPQRSPVRCGCSPCRAAFPATSSISLGRCEPRTPSSCARLEYHGLDIDPRALAIASRLTAQCAIPSVHYHPAMPGRDDYPKVKFNVVVSTGLGEFLRDDELAKFYAHVYDGLESGATFFTSATARDERSDALLRIAELLTNYRGPTSWSRPSPFPWKRLVLVRPTGLQTFATAIK